MNKKHFAAIAIAAVLLAVGCREKTQEFKAEDGSVTATCRIDNKTGIGHDWKITGADGREVVENYDSMRVVEVSEMGHPMTVCYHRGQEQIWLQYYTTMALRSKGTSVNGVREGEWVYYYANGNMQAKCRFEGGKEEGEYVVFRENGVPYYRGQYHQGVRTGEWEVYDPNGELVERKTY